MDTTVDDATHVEHADDARGDEHDEHAAIDSPQPVQEAGEDEHATTPAEQSRQGTDIVPMVSSEAAALIKATIAPDLSDAELVLFAAVCNRVGLDPFARQIYAVKRNDSHAPNGKRMTIQTGIDGFRLIARRTGQYGGRVGPYFCGPDGEWRVIRLADGTDAPAPWLDTEAPTAALVGVYRRGDSVPTFGVAKWKEYCPPAKQDQMWIKMPTTMLGKCAEAQAIRACFPAETSGLYTEDEMMQADVIDVATRPAALVGTVDEMSPRDVRQALVDRQLDASGKIDDMRARLAAAIAAETPAETPAAADSEAAEQPDTPETGEHTPEGSESASDPQGPAGETPDVDSGQPREWNPDILLMQAVVNEVKGMSLSEVMRQLSQREQPETGDPDEKRRRLGYALYLERGGTPVSRPGDGPAPDAPEHTDEPEATTLPLDAPDA